MFDKKTFEIIDIVEKEKLAESHQLIDEFMKMGNFLAAQKLYSECKNYSILL